MAKKKHKEGEAFKDWTLLKRLDDGGNGEVWLVENNNKQEVEDNKNREYVIKLLKFQFPKDKDDKQAHRRFQKAYKRFQDEVKIVTSIQENIKGILPILDYHLPENIPGSQAWYVMPRAIPLKKYLKNESVQKIVEAMITIAETLHKLHQKDISHRDIKPDNLFWFNDSCCIGDFGLVTYPDKQDPTRKGEKVGPRWTIAPEMERNPQNADATLADSYSFAKTLWIFLTNNFKGFEGQYTADSNLSLKKLQTAIFCTEFLDDLLTACTDNDPSKRLSLKEVAEKLKVWIELEEDYSRRNALQWEKIQEKLFPTAIPSRVIWEDVNDIVSILKVITSIDGLNHMFCPGGGGLNLINVKTSWENNCIELHDKSESHVQIVKPKKLVFESFGRNTEWNYFRLETEKLEPITNLLNSVQYEEILTEIKPGIYTNYECWEYNDFNGQKLPSSARTVSRIFKGDFVIFQRTSKYNMLSSLGIKYKYNGQVIDAYGDWHNKFNGEGFRDFIKNLSEAVTRDLNEEAVVSENSRNYQTPKLIAPSTFRINTRILTDQERNLLNSIIHLAEQEREESNALTTKYRLNIYSEYIEYLRAREPQPKRDEFTEFIENLSKDDLILVAAVMYGGRTFFLTGENRTYPLQQMIGDLKNWSKDNLKYSIYGKVGMLVDYLKAGITAYSESLSHVSSKIKQKP